jgi:hypothetical protein
MSRMTSLYSNLSSWSKVTPSTGFDQSIRNSRTCDYVIVRRIMLANWTPSSIISDTKMIMEELGANNQAYVDILKLPTKRIYRSQVR